MQNNPYLRIASLLLLLSLFACGKDKGAKQPDFDRAAMLESYATDLIRPAYLNARTKAVQLQAAWNTFTADATLTNLQLLSDAWLQTALAWQSANAFNFGPAGEAGLQKSLLEEIGTFPASEQKIETYIAANDFSLNNFDRDSRGLYAIEYLIFGKTGDPQAVLTAMQDPKRRNYLNAIIGHLIARLTTVDNAWNSYHIEFVQNNGTDAGSSTTLLYNEFLRSFESIKNFKVGLPAGKRAGQTQAEPQLVEAYYSGASLELLKKHIEQISNIYYGNADIPDGLWFYNYLRAVEGGPELIDATDAQWQAVLAALANIPESPALSVLIENEHPSIDALYTELQKHTRFFKSDMSSLLGIAITYDSGDGD